MKVMLEAAEAEFTNFANTTMDEVMAWVKTVGSSGFSVMLDTYQLANNEPSIEHGIEVTMGLATHIHLYDPSRWPPVGLRKTDWTAQPDQHFAQGAYTRYGFCSDGSGRR